MRGRGGRGGPDRGNSGGVEGEGRMIGDTIEEVEVEGAEKREMLVS